jgi:NAD(P) transhydrogenase
MIGCVSVHTGTIPSKTVREAILQLTGFAVKDPYTNGCRSRGDISVLPCVFRAPDLGRWSYPKLEALRSAVMHKRCGLAAALTRLGAHTQHPEG